MRGGTELRSELGPPSWSEQRHKKCHSPIPAPRGWRFMKRETTSATPGCLSMGWGQRKVKGIISKVGSYHPEMKDRWALAWMPSFGDELALSCWSFKEAHASPKPQLYIWEHLHGGWMPFHLCTLTLELSLTCLCSQNRSQPRSRCCSSSCSPRIWDALGSRWPSPDAVAQILQHRPSHPIPKASLLCCQRVRRALDAAPHLLRCVSPTRTCPCLSSRHYLCLQQCYSLLQPCCSFFFLSFFFFLIARCSPVTTIPEEALERRGLNNKENHGKPCAMKSGSTAKLKQSEAELEMSELFTGSNLSSCLLADKELGCFLRLIQEMWTKRYSGIPWYALKRLIEIQPTGHLGLRLLLTEQEWKLLDGDNLDNLVSAQQCPWSGASAPRTLCSWLPSGHSK